MSSPSSRRSFLTGVGVLAGGLLVGSKVGAATKWASQPQLVTAPWVKLENDRSGDATWLDGQPAVPGTLEGYASATSVNHGSDISFFVNTTSPTFTAKVYRLGYYQGLGARLVETKSKLKGSVQSLPVPDQYGTVDCNWPVTFVLHLNNRYVAGQYLVRLENSDGHFSFVPFMVRDDSSNATFVYMSAVTTWQAYNKWGGYSLYLEANKIGTAVVSNVQRAVRVSFNRPYDRDFANGAADLIGNEFPLLFEAERLSLDVTYWTDVDLHQRGHQLSDHQALLSLGHDEYYSPAMRDAVTIAVTQGVNVAFFGANFCYRKIRFEPSFNGDDRLIVNYRSTADPINATDPSMTTVNWSQPPSNTPESTFSGSLYSGVDGTGSLVVGDASTWLWRGTGLANGALLPNALGAEFNNFSPLSVNPPNVQILARSPVGGGVSDVTYVAERGQGGVFCSGTGHWIYDLSNAPRLGNNWIPAPLPGVTAPIEIATENLLRLFGSGPAGNVLPSVSNTTRF
ncbi:MAG TPA: N,N-dimethylformamidase beta subunit family domain-containing protein [Acidimicrobiales bacterium]|nr:N,N-dimethylformamidase beta subunit family domain-containing protein [Acidimicrobiales bacterium]